MLEKVNEFSYHCLMWLASLSLVLVLLYRGDAYAVQPTNRNAVTDLFDKEVPDRQKLERDIDSAKASAQSGIANKQGMEEIGVSESAAESKATELNSIRANDLENAGQAERAKEENAYYDACEVDYSDPKIINHKEDVDKIAEASERLMSRLIDGLKEHNIDCKTVKGDKELEPEYYLDIQAEQQRDITYNKHICEELRNKYNCSDTLTVHCKTKGIKWEEWQDKQIRIPGGELVNSGKFVFWVVKTRDRCFEYRLNFDPDKQIMGPIFNFDMQVGYKPSQQDVINGMREFLVAKHPGSTMDNIGMEMSAFHEGRIFSINGWIYGGQIVGDKDYAWNTYVVNYKYRDSSPVCLEWSEDWTERCLLKW